MFLIQRVRNCMDKMALKFIEKNIKDTEDIPIVVVTSADIVFYIKEYHIYKSIW